MAQIRVEERRGGAGWVWGVIALLIAVALAWYFYTTRATVPATNAVPTDTALNPPSHVLTLVTA
jgi:hypothetical protein